jgi:hypothetical protein
VTTEDIVRRLGEHHGADLKASIEGGYDSDPIFSDARDTIRSLTAVADAAWALVRSVQPSASFYTERVSEQALTALETALAAAGYDLTNEEMAEGFANEGGAP